MHASVYSTKKLVEFGVWLRVRCTSIIRKKSTKYRCVWLFDPQFGDHEIHHLLGNIVHKAAI